MHYRSPPVRLTPQHILRRVDTHLHTHTYTNTHTHVVNGPARPYNLNFSRIYIATWGNFVCMSAVCVSLHAFSCIEEKQGMRTRCWGYCMLEWRLDTPRLRTSGRSSRNKLEIQLQLARYSPPSFRHACLRACVPYSASHSLTSHHTGAHRTLSGTSAL